MKKDKKTAEKNPDITERKRAEETLRRLATVVRDSNDAIIIQDIDGRITAWNRGAELIYGYSEAEALGMKIERLSPPDKVAEQKEFTRRLIAGEAVTSFETRRVTKDGRILDVWLTVTKLVEDPAKSIISTGRDISRPIGVALIERNITQRKRAEEELQRSEQSFKSISENAHDGIIVALRNGAYIYANRRASEITGYAINEILKTGIEGLAHPDESLKLSERRKKILARENVPNQYDTVIIHKGGNAVPIEITSARTFWYGQAADIFVFRDTTERKRAEDALHASEERFRSLIEKSSDVIIVIDRDFKISYISPSFLKVFNRDLSKIFNKSTLDFVTEFVHQDDVKTVMKAFEDCLEMPGAERQAEFRFRLPDGRWLSIEATGKNLLDNPSIQGLVVNIRDITERKRAEAALRESEENFHRSLSDSPLGIRIVSADGKILYANQAILDIYGYASVEELKTTPHKKIYTPQSYAEHLVRKEQRQRGEYVTSNYEISIIRKDGEVRHIEVFRKEVLWNGEPQFQVLHNDITERKRAQEILRVSEERFRALIESSLDVISMVDAQGGVLYQSPNYANVWGRAPSGEAGKDMFKDVHPDDITLVGDAFARLLKNPKEPVQLEVRALHTDGTWRTLDIVAHNQIENPAVRSIVVNFRDITERKKIEKALRESEEYFKEITENSSDIVIITDKNGDMKYCSRSVERFTGYKLEEIIGKSVFRFIHPDDVQRAVSAFDKAILTKDTASNAFRIVHKDGTERQFDGVGRNLLANPSVAGFIMNIRDVTEHRRAQEALHASEERFRSLVEKSSDVIIVIGRDFKISYVSPTVHTVFDRDPSDLFGKSALDFVTEFVHQDDVKKVIKAFEGCLEMPGAERQVEFRFKLLDGTWRHLEGIGKNQLDNPSIQGLVVNLRDITERKQAEDALKESEQKYRLLADNSSDVIQLLDMNLKPIYISPSFTRVLGYSVEEALTGRMEGRMAPASIEKIMTTFQLGLIEEKRHQGSVTGETLELEMIRKDGSMIWTEMAVSFVRDSNGAAVGVLGIMRDITERKKAENNLRESESRYRLLAENASDVITVMDMNARPAYMSPSITRLLGYSVEEAMSREIQGGLTPESIKAATKALSAAITEEQKGENPEPVTLDLEFIRKDGSTVWVAASVALIRGPDGRPAEILATLHNISERKRAEDDLVKYKDHLEELVKERTEELDKAKAIAEHANKAKSDFLANMSHEIRTPLSSIIGFSELLFDEVNGPLNNDQKKYLGYVISSGQHLLSLINDILDLAKVESGKTELLPTSFSISDLLKNSSSFIAEEAMKHNIRLISDISTDVDVIEADERKVKQIIYNLLSNAVKFTPDGETITVGADVVSRNSAALPIKIRKGLPDTEYVLVSVKDTGIGIAKKDQSKVFTEFQQIEEPYSKKYEGTGLGLALSKKLVTLHGGKIWFESKGKGKGCTFYFILPLRTLPNA